MVMKPPHDLPGHSIVGEELGHLGYSQVLAIEKPK
jgi:hypothetical protein